MKKFYLFVFITFLSINEIFAGTVYWIGTNGNYSDGANWNTMSDGSGSSGAPVNTDNVVIDRNSTITIDGTYFPSSLLITNGAVVNFTNASTTKTYTIGGGSVFPAFKIEAGSTLKIQGTSTIILAMLTGSNAELYGILDFAGSSSKLDCSFGGGTFRIKNGGKIRYGGTSTATVGATTTFFMESGSVYEIYKDGSSFPSGTFDPNSLLLNTGASASPAVLTMATSIGSYGNYEFNSSSYTGSSIGQNQNITVNNFTLTDDGSGKWIYSTSPSSVYTLAVNGNLSVAANTNLVINNAASGTQASTLLVKGNFLNNGTITSNTNSGSVIEIGGTSNSAFSTVANGFTNNVSLKINKSAGSSVIASTDITLPNNGFSRLILTSGNIDMSANNKLLFLQNPAFPALSGGSLNSHIIGKFKRSSNQVGGYSFPLSNNAAQWAKATITTSNTNATDWMVEFIPSNVNANTGLTPGIIDVVTNYVWDITRTGVTPSDADFLTLYFSGLSSPGIVDPTQAKVVHWSGSTWTNLGGTDGGGSIDNSLGSTGGAAPGDPITTFSPFALGGATGVIPVTIEYLKGFKTGTGNNLFWKVNCFSTPGINLSLERSSDGRYFSDIYSVHADALRCQQPFDHSDNTPFAGLNYYRVKLTDSDGKVTYSKIIGLLNKTNGWEILGVMPNPIPKNGQAILNISSAQKVNLQLLITDINGKKLHKSSQILIAGSNLLPLDLSNLPSGNFQVTCTAEDGSKATTRIIRD